MVEKERRINQDRRENMNRRGSNDLNYSRPERRNTSSHPKSHFTCDFPVYPDV